MSTAQRDGSSRIVRESTVRTTVRSQAHRPQNGLVRKTAWRGSQGRHGGSVNGGSFPVVPGQLSTRHGECADHAGPTASRATNGGLRGRGSGIEGTRGASVRVGSEHDQAGARSISCRPRAARPLIRPLLPEHSRDVDAQAVERDLRARHHGHRDRGQGRGQDRGEHEAEQERVIEVADEELRRGRRPSGPGRRLGWGAGR